MVKDLKTFTTMEVLENMDLLTGPTERRLIKNVTAMMFSNHPEKFFPHTQISIVVFPEGLVKNPNRFSEKTFKGSVPTILRGALQYIKDVVIVEYVAKPKDRAESDRWFNFPYQAIEEGLVNAMYHRDYQEYQEVEVAVEPDEIRILSFSGPDRSISDSAIKECARLHSRRYRNSRLGDFLKELDLTEGRSTGIPTIQDELRKNGSPRAVVETDESRSYFLLRIPVHPKSTGLKKNMFNVEGKSTQSGDKSTQSGDKSTQSWERSNTKTIERIYELIKNNPTITRQMLSEKLGITEWAVKKHIRNLKQSGRIIRVGGDFKGHWQCIK